jgi:hypothetical protein
MGLLWDTLPFYPHLKKIPCFQLLMMIKKRTPKRRKHKGVAKIVRVARRK